jgi:hypothetical protein
MDDALRLLWAGIKHKLRLLIVQLYASSSKFTKIRKVLSFFNNPRTIADALFVPIIFSWKGNKLE